MKNRILFRLTLYFVTSFVIFAIVIGIVFSTLFSRHNLNEHMADLERRAVNAAYNLSGLLFGCPECETGLCTCSGSFLHIIEIISMSRAWVVDSNLNTIACGSIEHNIFPEHVCADLPDWAISIAVRAINEERLISESFGSFFRTTDIAAAMPIFAHNEIHGVVILHHNLTDIGSVTRSGITILLFSMIAAIMASLAVAVSLSSRFTNPLEKMKKTALQISGGDYTVKTGVKQPDEIGELAAAMDEMADRLDLWSKETLKLDKLKNDFIANISHELRTPVTVIRGSLEAICDGVVTDKEKVAEYHNQMLAESIYLERLMSDFLDLARLQNTDFAIDISQVDLKDIVDDVLRSMRRIAEEKQINLAFRYDEEDFRIKGDYGRLRQMLIIVLDNAIKFSAESKTVDIELIKSKTKIEIAIKDEGFSIDPEELQYIFNRFYKARSEQNNDGIGLGLAIAKQIADRHGVKIIVTDNDKKGAEFRFIF